MNLSLLRSFSAYSFAGFFGAAANFFVLPILSHYLSVEDYGILSIFNAYVTIAIPIVGLVAAGVITIEYYKIKDKTEFASFFSSVQLIPVIPFALLSVIAVLFRGSISELLEIPTEFARYIFLIPLLAILTIYLETYLAYLVVKKEAKHYLVINVAKSTFEIGLTLLFIIYFDMGWMGRILSWLLVTSIFTVVALVYFQRQRLLTFNINFKYYKAGVFFGLPLILHTIGKFVISQSDRIFIAKMVGVGDVGVYNIANQLASIMLIFITAFSNLYIPYLYERLSNFNHKAETEILQISYFYGFALLLGCTGITVVSQYLFGWFIDIKFIGAIPYIFWITLSYFLWGIYMLFAAYIYYFNKNIYLAYLAVINVVTNLGFNYIFIIKYGALGAAYATCLSYLITLILVIIIANKLIRISWLNFSKIINALFKNKTNVQ
ncbi:lipopolysaccharide biosynthesis protein [Rufibacter soli]